MLDRLIDFLIQFIELFYVARVVDQWEAGVVLRLGRYARDARPGLCWVWPLGIEHVWTVDTYPRPSRLPTQSLTTADGVAVVISAVVTSRICNPKRVILECGDAEEALIDSLTGTLAEHVTGAQWSDLTTEEFWRTVTTYAAKRARKWGVKVLSVQPADVARCKSLRLFGSAGVGLFAHGGGK